MAHHIGAKIPDELASRLEAHLDEIEDSIGYRPTKSVVLRDALWAHLDELEPSAGEAEDEGATA